VSPLIRDSLHFMMAFLMTLMTFDMEDLEKNLDVCSACCFCRPKGQKFRFHELLWASLHGES
jgi:hypothetical protein